MSEDKVGISTQSVCMLWVNVFLISNADCYHFGCGIVTVIHVEERTMSKCT